MIAAVSMVKDEVDIVEPILRHLVAEGVDELIVADNLSTDGTSDLLYALADELPLTVLEDPEVAYYQGRKMTALATIADEMGADWIIPFDADELFYSGAGRLGDVLPGATHDVYWVEARHHIPHTDDPKTGNPVERMQHRRSDEFLPTAKVVFRSHRDARLHMGNHDVDRSGPRCHGLIELREFQYRSFEHFCRKVRNGKRAYDATDLPADCGIHWRRNGGLDDEQLWAEWEIYLALPTVRDPAPLRVEVKN